MVQAADTVMTQIARDTHPGISDADLPAAISQIDVSDPRIGAQIFGTAFYGSESSSSNTYHCRGMGRAGDGILKKTPGFEKKRGSTSSQVAELHAQVRRLEEEAASRRLYQRRMEAYQRAMTAYWRAMAVWQQACGDVQTRNNAMQMQWFQDFLMAQSQGLPTPPQPIYEAQPEMPTPPEEPQQEEDQQQPPDGEDPQQQYDGQDPPDDNEMIDLGLDFD